MPLDVLAIFALNCILAYDDLITLKNTGRPTPIIKFDGKRQCRLAEWYANYTWLCGSAELKSLFCFPCLLFQRNKSAWSTGGSGIKDIGNLTNNVKKHIASQSHCSAIASLSLLGKVRIDEALDQGALVGRMRFNEEVSRNRSFLRHHVLASIFLASQTLAFRGHNEACSSTNRGNYIELLSLLTKFSVDDTLKKSIDGGVNQPYFTALSPEIQNDIIKCLHDSVLDELRRRVSSAPYISIMADETTDKGNVCQLAISIRIPYKGAIFEHFIQTVDVSKDRSADALSSAIVDSLNHQLNFTPASKSPVLVCQTFDGAANMAGKNHSVQTNVRQLWPYAKFIHCYAHKWALVIRQACDRVDAAALFFALLQNVTNFFRASPKRSSLLAGVIPSTSSTRWLSRGKSVTTIASKYTEIVDVLSTVHGDRSYDADTRQQALGLHDQLRQIHVVFFLVLFRKIFALSDVMTTKLQSAHIDPAVIAGKVCDYRQNITAMRTDNEFNELIILTKALDPVVPRQRKANVQSYRDCGYTPAQVDAISIEEKLKSSMFEVVDVVISQLDVRFSDIAEMDWIRLFDPRNFETLAEDTVSTCCLIVNLQKRLPYLAVDTSGFNAQLQVLYTDTHVRRALESKSMHVNKGIESSNMYDLYRALHDLELVDAMPDVHKAMSVALTMTLTSVACERDFSVLSRLKNYMRTTMGQDRLSNLMMLSIESGILRELSTQHDFVDKVIDRFAHMKERRVKLLYKQ